MSTRFNPNTSVYQYDPLDRLADSNGLQRFYNNTRIATEIEGTLQSRFFETHSHPLAVQQQGAARGTTLLATDQHASVLNGVSPRGISRRGLTCHLVITPLAPRSQVGGLTANDQSQ